MKSFKEYIKEMTTDILVPGKNQKVDFVKGLENPSANEIERFIERNKSNARWLILKDGTMWVWDAHGYTHPDIRQANRIKGDEWSTGLILWSGSSALSKKALPTKYPDKTVIIVKIWGAGDKYWKKHKISKEYKMEKKNSQGWEYYRKTS
jgi:hypothetical protein